MPDTLMELFGLAGPSRFSCVQLCATPESAAHQASPSLGFSRQEHWSGLPFPSPMHEKRKVKVKVKSLSHVWLLATPWTAAYQAPLSMGFSRQKYWSGVPLPSPQVSLRKLQTKLVEVMEFQLSYSKSWKMMLWKCCTKYASKFGKLSSGHRTGKVGFNSNPKERQCQRMLKLPHNCTHLTR